LVNPQNGNDDYNNFVSGFPPILPLENAFFPDIQQGAFGFDGIMNPPDALDAFLNQTLVDPDEHSSTTSKVQYDSDIPTEFENPWNMQVLFRFVLSLPSDVLVMVNPVILIFCYLCRLSLKMITGGQT